MCLLFDFETKLWAYGSFVSDDKKFPRSNFNPFIEIIIQRENNMDQLLQ